MPDTNYPAYADGWLRTHDQRPPPHQRVLLSDGVHLALGAWDGLSWLLDGSTVHAPMVWPYWRFGPRLPQPIPTEGA